MWLLESLHLPITLEFVKYNLLVPSNISERGLTVWLLPGDNDAMVALIYEMWIILPTS